MEGSIKVIQRFTYTIVVDGKELPMQLVAHSHEEARELVSKYIKGDDIKIKRFYHSWDIHGQALQIYREQQLSENGTSREKDFYDICGEAEKELKDDYI
jgi:hypothetical protein